MTHTDLREGGMGGLIAVYARGQDEGHTLGVPLTPLTGAVIGGVLTHGAVQAGEVL